MFLHLNKSFSTIKIIKKKLWNKMKDEFHVDNMVFIFDSIINELKNFECIILAPSKLFAKMHY